MADESSKPKRRKLVGRRNCTGACTGGRSDVICERAMLTFAAELSDLCSGMCPPEPWDFYAPEEDPKDLAKLEFMTVRSIALAAPVFACQLFTGGTGSAESLCQASGSRCRFGKCHRMGLWQDCSAGAACLVLPGFSCVPRSQAKEQREAIICQVEEMGRKFSWSHQK